MDFLVTKKVHIARFTGLKVYLKLVDYFRAFLFFLFILYDIRTDSKHPFPNLIGCLGTRDTLFNENPVLTGHFFSGCKAGVRLSETNFLVYYANNKKELCQLTKVVTCALGKKECNQSHITVRWCHF